MKYTVVYDQDCDCGRDFHLEDPAGKRVCSFYNEHAADEVCRLLNEEHEAVMGFSFIAP